jgi:hypothetical protein
MDSNEFADVISKKILKQGLYSYAFMAQSPHKVLRSFCEPKVDQI